MEKGNRSGPPSLVEAMKETKDKFNSFFGITQSVKSADLKECNCSKVDKEVQANLIVECKTCKLILYNKTFIKPYKIAMLLLISGYGASNFIDYAVSDNRYPLAVEYEVLSSCINSDRGLLSSSTYSRKQDVCLCALEETMNEISYVRFNLNRESFFKVLRDHKNQCL